MKHFAFLFLLAVLLYVAWSVVDAEHRGLFLGFVKRHAIPLVVIFVVLTLGLVSAVYLPALSLL